MRKRDGRFTCVAFRIAAHRPFLERFWWLAYVVLAIFFLRVGTMIVEGHVGIFQDEGIHIYSGLRTLRGHPKAEDYLFWASGSLLWPLASAVGFKIAGLAGARFVALILTTAACALSLQAGKEIFGRRVLLPAAILMTTAAPVMHIAFVADHDALSIFGFTLALWGIACTIKRNSRAYLVATLLGSAIGIVAKYPAAIMMVPLLLLLVLYRRRAALLDLFLMFTCGMPFLLAYFVPVQDQVSRMIPWRVTHNFNFGVGQTQNVVSQLWVTAPTAAVAVVGLFFTRHRRAGVALAIAVAMWPLFHILSASSPAWFKHGAMGMILVAPLAGEGLAALSATRFPWPQTRYAALIFVGLFMAQLAAIGQRQLGFDLRSWPDIRPVVSFLRPQLKPTDIVLASKVWAYRPMLYPDAPDFALTNIYEPYKFDDAPARFPDPCTVDWFVDEHESDRWQSTVRDEIMACGTFQLVFSNSVTVTNLNSQLTFVTYKVRTSIWKNTVRAEP